MQIRHQRQKNCRFVDLRQDRFLEWSTPVNSKEGRKHAAPHLKAFVSVSHQQAEVSSPLAHKNMAMLPHLP